MLKILRKQSELSVRRSWPFLINLLQTEDKTGFGTQFRAIPRFSRVIDDSKESALTWTLFAILSSIKELWHIIDTKSSPFRTSSWEGWILCAIHEHCFKFDSILIDSKSPFKKLKSTVSIVDKVNDYISRRTVNNTNDDSHDINLDGEDFF